MKNSFLLVSFFISVACFKDFDLSMDIFCDVNRNNAFVVTSPNPKKIIKFPLTFVSLFEENMYLGSNENSVVRMGDFNMDNIINVQDINFMLDISDQMGYDAHFDINKDFSSDILDIMKVIELSKKINHPSNFELRPLRAKIEGEDFYDPNSNLDMLIFRYSFADSQESVAFWSKDFKDENRKFNFQFLFMSKFPLYSYPSKILKDSIQNSSSFLDSITIKLNLFSPIVDSIDLKYYADYNKDKVNFVNLALAKNQLKEMGGPIVTSFITVPNSFDLVPTSSIHITYKNPKNLILQNIIENGKKEHTLVLEKLSKTPVIVLATLLGIMVIFIVVLVFKQTIIKEEL